MNIKKFISLALLVCIFGSFLVTAVAATGAENWFIIKKGGNKAPDFPPSADFVAAHGGYFIDNSQRARECKTVYLTFDAGYENGNIEKILDILKEYNVPGAFFILSNLINKNSELVKRMADEGHTVCNHTKNHKDMTTLTDEEMQKNLEALEKQYKDVTGKDMAKYFRFPEGRYDEDKIKLCDSLGYKTFFWSLTHADWDNSRQPNDDKSIRVLTENIHPGAIILLHPTSETNVRILPVLIEKWTKMGYTFGKLEDIVNGG